MSKTNSLIMAERLKQLRKERKLSHVALSTALNQAYGIDISRDSLMSYEVTDPNHSKPYKNEGMRVEYLRCLADFYGVSADYLLGLTNDPSREPSAIDELGLSPQAIAKLKGCCSEGRATGFIDGINTLLTLPRLSMLAKNINRLSRNIILETNRLKQYSTNNRGNDERIFPPDRQMDIQDADFSSRLVDIIEKEYPEYKGRIEVYCGRATLECQMQNIIELFRADIEIATQYLECLVNPLDEV